MYGSDKTDLIVKYYDLAFGISGKAELAWYLAAARASGGPILDMACGTGRLALVLAGEGFNVTGIDQSVGMLNQFNSKLREQPTAIRERVRIENQGMTDFNLGERFNTVICCDAFFHNLTVEAQINSLKCVTEHLAPMGCFTFNLPRPTCEYLLKSEASGGKEFQERGRYDLPDGSGSLLVEQAQAGDIENQRITTILRFTRTNPEGLVLDTGESSWTTRFLFRYEAIHLLYRSGFEVESLVGDYNNVPVEEGGQLIFKAKLG